MSNELRDLLIEMRMELRSARSGFLGSRLCKRLDAVISEQGRGGMNANKCVSTAPSTTHQVAMAWQQAAKGLRQAHPQIYDALVRDVLGIVRDKRLLQADAESDALRTRLQETQVELTQTQHRLDLLCERLAQLAPDVLDGETPYDTALRRVTELRVAPVGPGPGLAPAPASYSAPGEVPPSSATLVRVTRAEHTLTAEQLEWCVSEAMVLSGFARTPAELMAEGPAVLARLILEHAPQEAVG